MNARLVRLPDQLIRLMGPLCKAAIFTKHNPQLWLHKNIKFDFQFKISFSFDFSPSDAWNSSFVGGVSSTWIIQWPRSDSKTILCFLRWLGGYSTTRKGVTCSNIWTRWRGKLWMAFQSMFTLSHKSARVTASGRTTPREYLIYLTMSFRVSESPRPIWAHNNQ